MKKPKDFIHEKHSLASVSGAFYCEELKKKLPNIIYINCEEISAKKARKLAKWLIRAANYVEKK